MMAIAVLDDRHDAGDQHPALARRRRPPSHRAATASAPSRAIDRVRRATRSRATSRARSSSALGVWIDMRARACCGSARSTTRRSRRCVCTVTVNTCRSRAGSSPNGPKDRWNRSALARESENATARSRTDLADQWSRVSASITRATTSRSTSLRFLRAVSRKAAAAQTVKVTHRAGGRFMQQHDRIGAEYFALDANARQAHAQILGGVLGSQRGDLEAVMDARVQRAIAAQREPLAKLGQTDEDQREDRATIPAVVEEDVQMIERVPAAAGAPRRGETPDECARPRDLRRVE